MTDIGTILDNFNLMAEKLFKSTETQVYEVLDKITTIGPSIFEEEPLKRIIVPNQANGIILVANSCLLFFILYYVFTQLLSLYNGNKVEHVYAFVIKIILVGIISNHSYFITKEILTISNYFNISIELAGKEVAKKDITFQNLKENIVSIQDLMKNDAISLEGLIKGMISFGVISVLIQFCIRYVTVIFLIMIAPLACITLCSPLAIGVFKSWFKMLISNLLLSAIVKLIITVPLVCQEINSLFYKIVLVGSIYLIYKINQISKELFARFSSESGIQSIFRGG